MAEEQRPTTVRVHPMLDLLTQLRMAVGQLRLYPAASPQAQKAVAPAQAALAAYPGAQGRVTIARTMRGLLVNGQRPPAGDASALAEKSWLQLLQEANVNSLVLLTSVRVEELTAFLAALAKKFWDLKDGKEINARLRDAGALQAWVEEVQFVAMAKGDLLIEGASQKLEAAGARVSEIVQTLEQVIDGTASEGLAEQVRLEIMRKLLDSDPTLIAKAQAMNHAVGEEGGGPAAGPGRRTLFGGGKAPGWISFDQARKSLAEIARLLKTAEGPERESLRALGHLLLGGFRYDPLLCELLKKFLTDEAIDLIPAWMLEEPKPVQPAAPRGPAERVPELLALPEDTRVEALRDQAPALVKDLLGLKRADLAADLIKAAVEHARHVSAGHRLKAVTLLVQLHPLLEADELRPARAALEARVVAALDLERDRAIYPVLVDFAAAAVEALLPRGEIDAALPLLEAVRKQSQAEDPEYLERRDISRRALEKIAGGLSFPVLLEKFRVKHPSAARAIQALGAHPAKAVVDRMRASENMAERMGLAQLLLHAGPEAGAVLAAETLQTLAPSESLKLVDLLRLAMTDEEAEAALATVLRHPALAVRRRAAAYLKGRPTAKTGPCFMEALKKESDPALRATFIETLGALKVEAAFPVLGQVLDARGETDDVRGAAAAALAVLGKPQAVPILAKASAKGRGLTLVLNPAPTAVRAAAARALASFTRYPEARDALRRGADDPEAVVRDAARDSLSTPLVKVFGEAAKGVAVLSEIDPAGKLPEGAFAGSLNELPLDVVCTMLEEGARSGLLRVNVGGSNAQVWLDKGAVVSAEYGQMKGQDAFNQFCRWEGTFLLFTPGGAAPSPGAPESLIKMLMDACEVRDQSG